MLNIHCIAVLIHYKTINDLIIFKCFRLIFSLKKRTRQFPLSLNLYFEQKRVPKVVNLPLTDETLCLRF